MDVTTVESFYDNPLRLLIICPLVFLSGLVDAVAGGGGLISLPAYMIAGLPAHVARGTNKVGNMFGTGLTTVRFARKGFIPIREAIPCVIFALGGSFAGSELGLLMDEKIFTIIMLVVIPLTAAYVWFHKKDSVEKEPYGTGKTIAIACLTALVLGLYDGFYGPGTGTFLILALTELAHMCIKQANGISKAINLATNVASAVVFIANGKVLIPVALIGAVCSMGGNLLGSRLFLKKDVKIVRPFMIGVLVIFFVKILVELVGQTS